LTIFGLANRIVAMKLFGSSGIRRISDGNLFGLTLKVASAMGKKYKRVIIGCDTRTSSDALKHMAMAGMLASGAKVFDAGLLPTPTLALAARRFEAAVMITASHNPPEYNGMKLINPDGSAFGPQQQKEIQELVSDPSLGMVSWDKLQNSAIYHGAIEQHVHHIRKYFPGAHKIKVVVDCVCGAASTITPYLLQGMGCDVLSLNSNPSGFFPHPVEPLETNLQDLINAVRESHADLGLAHDGDADRLVGVDGRGRFINGDKMMCLLAQTLNARKVVTTVDASSVVEKFGYSVERTAVGDSFVSEELKKGGDFGGEPSGAWIFPQNTLCPDGIFAAGCIVSITSQGRLIQMLDAIPTYHNLRSNVAHDGIDMEQLEARLIARFEPLAVNRLDGIKLTLPEGWMLVRPSGTEPKIRITVEGIDSEWVLEVHDRAVKIITGDA